MKNRFFWLGLSIGVVFISSCNEDPVEPNIPPAWERFLGRYNVVKLENQQEYELNITVDSSEIEPSGRVIYKLVWENFDASFDTLIGEFTQSINPNEIDGFNAPHGVSDHDGNRWALWLLPHDGSTPELENTLVNDTILFYFQKSNIAFYVEDGVPFYECECKHLAVKVE